LSFTWRPGIGSWEWLSRLDEMGKKELCLIFEAKCLSSGGNAC